MQHTDGSLGEVLPEAGTITLLSWPSGRELEDWNADDCADWNAHIISIRPSAHPVLPHMSRVRLKLTAPDGAEYIVAAWIPDR
jgi:hypothetical protein